MTAIEDGLYQPAMKARMAELERQKADIAARMPQAPQAIPDMHPGIAEIYRRQMERFTQALEDPETRLDASEALRSLIHRIVLHPGEKRGEIHATLHGALMGILDFVQDIPRPIALVTTKVASSSRRYRARLHMARDIVPAKLLSITLRSQPPSAGTFLPPFKGRWL